MTDVAIHRCILRIHRTGGWAWGVAPSALLEAARRALPALIGARLPALADELVAPVHVGEPLRIRIATTTRELAALGESDSGASAGLRTRITDAVAAAVARAVEHAPRETRVELPAVPGSVAGEAGSNSGPELGVMADPDRDAPLRALRSWSRSGVLSQILPALGEAATLALHDLVFGTDPTADPPGPALLASAQAARAMVAALPQLRDVVRQRIAIAAALLEASPATPAKLRAAVDAVLPVSAVVIEARTAMPVPASDPAAVPAPHEVAAPAVGGATTRELEIRSVLPFLLLPALHHAGWLDTATVLLATHELAPAAFALAAGLAAKVLDPLERGWSRSRADRMVIAAFCGTDEPLADADIAAAAGRLRPILPALAAALRGTIAKARRAVPLVLWRDDRGWLLLDTDGMVALAAHAELRPMLVTTPNAPIIVPAALADGATLEQIELANTRFLSDAPRGRAESWRRFAGLDRAMITNDTATPVARLVALTAGLDATLALAEELASVLAERPAIPRDPVTAFEATCTLAATAALADLGARLFPTEPTTPVLALTRFRDLDARVVLAPDRIVVRVPLGRRHADLMRHGILGELPRVPWLGERLVDLGGA